MFNFLGHYIYIEASSRKRYDSAQIVSPSYSSPQGGCLSFWYNMHGSQIGTLNVNMKVGSRSTQIWRKSGDQGQRWQQAQATITPSTNYTIMFEGVIGTGFRGDIAIDDISISSTGCTLPGIEICLNLVISSGC